MKLVMLGVFVYDDLFVSMVKRYDPILRAVTNNFGGGLLKVSTTTIGEVFMLGPTTTLLEEIDLGKL